MTRTEVLYRLSTRQKEIQKRFGVIELSLFGSIARDEGSATSDIDLLVKFQGKATLDAYMDLKFFLEEILELRVDLVTEKGLRPKIRPHIMREAIRVA